MKTKKLFLLLTLLLFIKAGFSINTLRSNLVNAGSKSSALSIYQNYTASEKASVWDDKMNQVLNLGIWSNDQVTLLNQVRAQISSNVFSDSTAFASFSGFMQTWKTSALNKFSMEQLRFILTLVSDYDPTAVPTAGDGTNNCNCATDSDWCGGSIFDEDCKKLQCTEVSGCGTFWSYTCTGMCQGAQPSNTNGVIIY